MGVEYRVGMTAVFTPVEHTSGVKCFIPTGSSFGTVAYSSENCCHMETAHFFHRFAALLNAGIPVQQALDMAGKECSPRLTRFLQEVSWRVDSGQDLGTALGLPDCPFDAWTVGLIRLAESSGALADGCEQVAIALEKRLKQQRLSHSILASILWILLSLLAIPILLTQQWVGVFLLLLVGGLAGSAIWNDVTVVEAGLLSLLQPLPLAQDLVLARTMIDFADLELPLRCGASIVQSLGMLRRRLPAGEMADMLGTVIQSIQTGKSLSQSLQGQIPPLALQMIRTGEETGMMDTMLGKIGEYYVGQRDRSLRQLEGLLRPLGIVALGIPVLLLGVQLINTLVKGLPG